MFNTFSPDAKYSTGGSLIPANTSAFAVVSVQKIAQSQATGGRYAKLDLTIAGGDYEGRHLFPMIGDPSDAKNSEKYQQMSLGAIQHMLEAAGVFDHNNPATYQRFANATFEQVLQALDGKTVAVKIKVEKGKDGYEDKNVVADWLSPNPRSGSHKSWLELVGQSQPSMGSAQTTQVSRPAATAPGATPTWLGNR